MPNKTWINSQLCLGKKNERVVSWAGCLSLWNSQRIVQCHRKCDK